MIRTFFANKNVTGAVFIRNSALFTLKSLQIVSNNAKFQTNCILAQNDEIFKKTPLILNVQNYSTKKSKGRRKTVIKANLGKHTSGRS